MNRSILFFASLLFLFILPACSGSGGEDAIGKLAGEVIAVHDEVMPMMGEIMQLRRTLGDSLQSLQAADPVDSALVEQFEEALSQLNTAKRSMEDWMHGYETPGEDMADAEALAYLKGEMVKVEQVKENMLTSVAFAKSLLKP
ncbi:MAG: hypothetical protein D6722_21815 [Bacteroidetes bacterium]|nr:MAG: hypothetical protein D6722_21815 [Bacteroidota bacterium]